MSLSVITEIPLENRRTLIRVDFNVPLRDGRVADDARIRATLSTLQHAAERGARIVLMSHLGRPKGKVDPRLSLRPVAEHLQTLWPETVRFAPDCIGDEVVRMTREIPPGGILLLENLRFHPGETRNDPEFARALARNGEVYVNDAFGAAHRAHASVSGAPAFFEVKGIGLLMQREVSALERLITRPEPPFIAILGGAKVADKIPVIRNLLPKVDRLLLGGAMAYTFLKARGYDTGNSRVEPERVEEVQRLLAEAERQGTPVELPRDHVVVESLEERDLRETARVVATGESFSGCMGVDIGPVTAGDYRRLIAEARTVFWNGPMGVYERREFARGTREIARALAQVSGFTVVGGGDSLAALAAENLLDQVSHASTGGGASLEFVAGRDLPGLQALRT